MKKDNELIAEFLGYTQPHPKYPSTTYWYKEGEEPLTTLRFDRDWNWLMEAIQKILDICIDADKGKDLEALDKYFEITDNIPDIKETYKAVINFIKNN